ncbi:MAG: hypothetical protein RJQ09_02950 [Cyclobacteriaceae bacterium]
MKKIGILFGMENTFPPAFVERVNKKAPKGIMAEFVSIDKVEQGAATDYAVIIDRISQDVPFYRAYLKNAALSGTAVINNPFWWSADEKFFNNALAVQMGVPVPNTVLLPSKERPTDTSEQSFRNLELLDWDYIDQYVGFPAFMKPYAGGGWKNVYKLENKEEFERAFAETGQLVMMLQEAIDFTDYFRCYWLGGRTRIMHYDPRNPHHLRYIQNPPPVEKKLLARMEDLLKTINQGLGYDFNTVEFAIRDGVPYAIDFGNPAPDAEATSVGPDNFEWVVENAAELAIERAKAHKDGQTNLTWGKFMHQSVLGNTASNSTAKPVAKSAAKPTAKKQAVKADAKVAVKKVAAKPATKKAPVKPAKKAAPKPVAKTPIKKMPAKPAAKQTTKKKK